PSSNPFPYTTLFRSEVVVAELRPVELLHAPETDRRPTDLAVEGRRLMRILAVAQRQGALGVEPQHGGKHLVSRARLAGAIEGGRSEEHTSELQSRSD